jgi:hypothetical protein
MIQASFEYALRRMSGAEMTYAVRLERPFFAHQRSGEAEEAGK